MGNSHTINAAAICVQTKIPGILWGLPGVGKTAAIEQMADVLEIPIETVIGSTCDPTDFGGLPLINESGIEVGGKLVRTTDKAPPGWAVRMWEAEQDSGLEVTGLVFFDEMTTAPPAVQAGMLRTLIPDHRGRHWVGDLPLAKAAFLAAANPPDVAAAGCDLSPPMANRYVHLPWEIDAEGWSRGMINGWSHPAIPMVRSGWREAIPAKRSAIAAFIRSNRDLIHVIPEHEDQRGKAWPSPRTWDYAATLLAAVDAAGADEMTRNLLLSGCVGEGPAVSFVRWMADLDLPDPDEILSDPRRVALPRRGDQVLVIGSNLAEAAVGRGKTAVAAAWTYLDRLAEAFGDDMVVPGARILARGARDTIGAPLPALGMRLAAMLTEMGAEGSDRP